MLYVFFSIMFLVFLVLGVSALDNVSLKMFLIQEYLGLVWTVLVVMTVCHSTHSLVLVAYVLSRLLDRTRW